MFCSVQPIKDNGKEESIMSNKLEVLQLQQLEVQETESIEARTMSAECVDITNH